MKVQARRHEAELSEQEENLRQQQREVENQRGALEQEVLTRLSAEKAHLLQQAECKRNSRPLLWK